jgi:hypothetical protein
MKIRRNGWTAKCVESVIPNRYNIYINKGYQYIIARGMKVKSSIDIYYDGRNQLTKDIIKGNFTITLDVDNDKEFESKLIIELVDRFEQMKWQ